MFGAKALRSVAFGLGSATLGLYLAELGLPPERIGLVLSAALVGTLALTVVIASGGDRIGRKRLLRIGSALMLLAALVPLAGGDVTALALIALSGMVAVTANEPTGLQTLDQAILPGTVPATARTGMFAAYNVISAVGSSVGALLVGLGATVGTAVGLAGPERHAPSFAAYAILGLACLILVSRLDAGVEVRAAPVGRLALGRSRSTVARLSALFAVDSLAGGFVVQSFLAYWFVQRFGTDASGVAALFFAGGLLTAGSFPVAALLAHRIGLIRTMVLTHIPSSIFLIAMALVPDAALAAALFLARAALSSMDVPARQSYTMAVVDPEERTAAAGVTSLARGIAQAVGPALASAVLVPIGLAAPLVACGILKISYDIALFGAFRAVRAPEEMRAADRGAGRGDRAGEAGGAGGSD